MSIENGPSAAKAPSNTTSQNIFRGVSTTAAGAFAMGGAWDVMLTRIVAVRCERLRAQNRERQRAGALTRGGLAAGRLRGRRRQAFRQFDIGAPRIGDVGDRSFAAFALVRMGASVWIPAASRVFTN